MNLINEFNNHISIRIWNQFVQINNFSIHHQQTHRGKDHGYTLIHNSLKKKISRDKPNQESEGPLK